MANVLVEERSLQAIADAIRYKTGGTDTYKPREMAPAIRNMPVTGVLQNLSVSENGTYTPEAGVDGFNSVSVAVPGGFGAGDEGKVVQNGALISQSSLNVTANGTYDTTAKNSVTVSIDNGGSGNVIFTDDDTRVASMVNGEVVFLEDLYDYRVTAFKPVCQTPSSGIAGQNSNNAIDALNSTQTSTFTWTTNDRNYSDLWIGADYGEPVVLNSLTVAPRTWNGARQISDVIIEVSENGTEWTKIFTAPIKGNTLADAAWNSFFFRNYTSHRYYRLRTMVREGSINGSVTFTLYGLGFFYNDTQIPSAGYRNVYWKNNGATHRYLIDTD